MLQTLPFVGQNTRIYHGKLTLQKIIMVNKYNSNINDRSYNNPNGILSYDYYLVDSTGFLFDFQNTQVNISFFSLK